MFGFLSNKERQELNDLRVKVPQLESRVANQSIQLRGLNEVIRRKNFTLKKVRSFLGEFRQAQKQKWLDSQTPKTAAKAEKTRRSKVTA